MGLGNGGNGKGAPISVLAQRFLVPINHYIYFVPFVIEEDVIFLNTAFPHRKATKQYLMEKQDGH